MDSLQTITDYLQNHWPAILSLVGGGAGLSLVLEVLLNKLHIDGKKLAYTALHLLAFVSTVATYFLANLPAFDTLPVYASLVIAAQTWHRFALSPAYNKYIVPYLEYLETKKALPVTPAVDPNLPPAEHEFTLAG